MGNVVNNVINALTVDVEDYFHVSAFESVIQPRQWAQWPLRVERNTDQILDLFSRHNVKATFFMLGWVSERCPSLVLRIVNEGHELASHGYAHRRATEQVPEMFREDIIRAKKLLEDIGGISVKGYRAPSYSIAKKNIWAWEELTRAGYEYSSSVYPIKHDLYGMPDAPRHAFYPDNAPKLLEIPITTIELGSRRLPCGGGGFFRLYPYWLSRYMLKHVIQNDRQPTIFYFHPWEIDPRQPRVPGIGVKSRIRHYLNLNRTEKRLEKLLSEFTWGRMDEIFLATNDIAAETTKGGQCAA